MAKDPDKIRKWIRQTSGLNGWSVTVIAGLFTVASLIGWSPVGVIIGLAVTGAGGMELHGRRRLATGQPGARDWMAGSQLWLLTCVLVYAAYRLLGFDWGAPLSDLSPEEVRQLSIVTGFHGDFLGQLVSMLFGTIYVVVAAVTLVYQGGLGLYYWRRVGWLEREHPP
jgi:hypothetical protein